MPLKKFTYIKANNDKSVRIAYPLGMTDDKILAIDLSEYETEEVEDYRAILETLHKQHIQAIKDAGLGTNFRYFFIDGMENIEDV